MKRFAATVIWAMMSLGLAGLGAGCAPEIENHGYAPDDALLADITAGQDTKSTVQRKIGRPSATGVFNNDGWYYVSTRVERYTYHAPKVVDRRVVAVRFTTDDVVESVKTYGIEDGRVVDLETRTTPTYGRELTILQQLLGNIGSLSGSTLNKSSSGN
jgi:outer membrane protein assembly factor BamE (lipoprotein component of BamABCDE complex)